MKKIGFYRIVILSFIFLFACSPSNRDHEFNISTLRIGILPKTNKEKLIAHYGPLLNYLSRETGIPVELTIPKTNDELLSLFQKGRIDLALLSGHSFVKANLWDSAVPLVSRDVDTKTTSYFLARGDNPARKLSEFQNKNFGFGPILSASDHWMPRYFLKQKGILPEKFFSKVRYSKEGSRIAEWIRDGLIDLGAVSSTIVKKMYEDKKIDPKEVRVLLETPSYPDYVWALNPYYSKAVRSKISNAFLNLSTKNETHAKILAGIDARGFLAVSVKDYKKLRDILRDF